MTPISRKAPKRSISPSRAATETGTNPLITLEPSNGNIGNKLKMANATLMYTPKLNKVNKTQLS